MIHSMQLNVFFLDDIYYIATFPGVSMQKLSTWRLTANT